MKAKPVRTEQALAGLLAGVNQLVDAVKITLGPRGRSVVIEQLSGPPQVTHDGVTVATQIQLSDPLHNLGARLVKGAAFQVEQELGDGTTTALVIAQALLREGFKAVALGVDPMQIKHGLDLGVERVCEHIGQQAMPCESREDLARVASLSAHGDTEVGQAVAQALEFAGAEGAVAIQDSDTRECTARSTEGLSFEQGYVSPRLLKSLDERIELWHPRVLIYAGALSENDALLPLLESVRERAQPMLLIASELSPEVLNTLVLNRQQGRLNVIAVRAPGRGEQQTERLGDLAVMTGARLIDPRTGEGLARASINDLGGALRAYVEREATTLLGGGWRVEVVQERMAAIRKELVRAGTERRRHLESRLATLSGRGAAIRIGAATEIEQRERREQLDDALHAARAARAGGVVAGGGVALIRAASALDALNMRSSDQAAGVQILRRALHAPLAQIAENAGAAPQVVVEAVQGGQGPFGFDASRSTYGDLIELGVIDAANVVSAAVRSAVAIAGEILTVSTAVMRDRVTFAEAESVR